MRREEVIETQKGIKIIKDYFEARLSENLNLIRVSAPLFVTTDSGLNDNLTGVEKPVSFELGNYKDVEMQIVQSLSKWKRMALNQYEFKAYEGIYTDMNAIRPDEVLGRKHSIYVDQWDWELIINEEDRNLDYLKKIVEKIYKAFLETEENINNTFKGKFQRKLPENITFISSQELEDLYPDLEPEEREKRAAKKDKAIFIYEIGHKLKSGKPHDFRSPDYDDWNLNGDIIFWDPVLEDALELSSMGIRVDEESLDRQLKLTDSNDRRAYKYHKMLLNGELPLTIGGGIGQSRICMFFLEKRHIGEVQAAIWPEEVRNKYEREGIKFL